MVEVTAECSNSVICLKLVLDDSKFSEVEILSPPFSISDQDEHDVSGYRIWSHL